MHLSVCRNAYSIFLSFRSSCVSAHCAANSCTLMKLNPGEGWQAKKILTKLNVECKNMYMKNTDQNRVWFKGAVRSGVKCTLPNTPPLFFFGQTNPKAVGIYVLASSGTWCNWADSIEEETFGLSGVKWGLLTTESMLWTFSLTLLVLEMESLWMKFWTSINSSIL